MRLASVRIVSSDVPALGAFYQQLTGATPVGFEEYLELSTDGLTLAICSERSAAAEDAGSLTADRNRSVVLEFAVGDVDAERARLEGVVSDWVRQPTDQEWGNRSMLFRDPDGNLVNVYTPPPPR